MLQSLCFTRVDGDWLVVLLLIRLDTACLGWVCLHVEGAPGDLVRDTGFSVTVESGVTAILAGMEKERVWAQQCCRAEVICIWAHHL